MSEGINGRHLWNSIGINIPLFLTSMREAILQNSHFFAALLIDVTFTTSQHKNITSCFRKNKTIPVWDRWKWRLIGSLKASKILEDGWVRRFTSETYSLCESPNPLDQQMHHENWGKLKFKSSKSHARLNPGLKTQAKTTWLTIVTNS